LGLGTQPAQRRERGPRDDPIDPRFELAVAAIRAEAAQHRDQRLLRDIVDARIAAHQVAHEVANAR